MCGPTSYNLADTVKYFRGIYPDTPQRTLARHIFNSQTIEGNPGWATIYSAVRRFDRRRAKAQAQAQAQLQTA